MVKLGLKIGSKDVQYTRELQEYFEKGIFQYIELFAISGTFEDTIAYWKQFDIPFGIHAPHSVAGLNLADTQNRTINKAKITESIKFADELKAEYIIFHSGTNGTSDETICQLTPFADERFLIENKPIKGLDGKFCVGTDFREIKSIIDGIGKGIGFCLDFGHAICAANTLKKDPIEFINDLCKLKPRVFHLTDGDYKSEFDSHLHYGEGSYPLKKLFSMVPSTGMVTNEAKRAVNKDLSTFLEDFKYFELYRG